MVITKIGIIRGVVIAAMLSAMAYFSGLEFKIELPEDLQEAILNTYKLLSCNKECKMNENR